MQDTDKPEQKHKDKTARRDYVLQVTNASQVDCISLPNLVLSLDESERLDSSDDDIQLIEHESDSSSTDNHYVLSPSYRLQATSDVSTEPVTPLLSPNTSSGHLSPEVSKFRANPLSSAHWSDID